MSYLDTQEEFLKEMEFLKTLGGRLFLSPFAARSKQQLFGYNLLYFLVLFTFMQLFFTLCLTGLDDWMEIINIAPNMGACFMSIIKFSTISNNTDLYDKIHKHFCNNLWDLVPFNSEENIKTFVKYTKVSIRIKRFFLIFSATLIIVVDSFPWLLMTYENRVLGMDSPHLYPFDAWYPFDKVKWYWVAYIWESLMTAIVICLYTFTNLVHLTYVTFICMELSLLGNCLHDLISVDDINNISARKNLDQTHYEIKKKLKFIIKKYIFLNEISAALDKALGNGMLLAYVFDAVFICLTAFSFTVINDLYKSLRYFSFFISLLVEMFNLCIIGQVLIDHSESLTEKIYCSHWIYADAETRKILLMLILRTQRPFKLTARGFITMNLSTYSQICSSSYQLFNLLRTMYEP